jgi:hypothetical protein
MSKLKTSATATSGGISGLGMIGLGIYGIGEIHGYFNVAVFIFSSILLLFLTSRFMGSRKQKKELIMYNPNEIFIVSFLFFMVLMGLYSCYSIFHSENKLGESITAYAIVIVAIALIVLPLVVINSYYKNRKDNITIGSTSIIISDDENIVEYKIIDILSYHINGTKLSLNLKEIGNKTIDLSELNLNRRDIKKLNIDIETRVNNFVSNPTL